LAGYTALYLAGYMALYLAGYMVLYTQLFAYIVARVILQMALAI
jgi:hypothetical protein